MAAFFDEKLNPIQPCQRDISTTKQRISLTAFQGRVLSDRRNELLASFPIHRVAVNLKNTWHSAATRIYRNWILYMSATKDPRRETSWFSHDTRLRDFSIARHTFQTVEVAIP